MILLFSFKVWALQLFEHYPFKAMLSISKNNCLGILVEVLRISTLTGMLLLMLHAGAIKLLSLNYKTKMLHKTVYRDGTI